MDGPLPSGATTLSAVPVGGRAVVRALHVDEGLVRWLRAVGVFEGQGVTVLRRGAFGGPMHVRVDSGGEFAIDRALAAGLEVSEDEARG
ncbi:MAG: FeoA family protein [Polyangiales bacterium]